MEYVSQMEYVSHIALRRTHPNVIEYDLTYSSPDAPDQTRTLHANPVATFHGPHTGRGGERQMYGGATTLWREDDTAMLVAFQRKYRRASVSFA